MGEIILENVGHIVKVKKISTFPKIKIVLIHGRKFATKAGAASKTEKEPL